jgi:hypothetical protein
MFVPGDYVLPVQIIDHTGQVFGALTVIAREGTKNTFAAWRVRCVCGNETVVPGHDLRSGGTTSCGCKRVELQSAKVRRHGETHTPTWKTWQSMRQRCSNPEDSSYQRYGGRGISVCERWDSSYENFVTDMGKRPRGKTIERKNNNGNYEPDNCVWATGVEQGSNKRNNRLLTFKGETHTVAEWTRRLGGKRSALKQRLRNGWSVEEALSMPFADRAPRSA